LFLSWDISLFSCFSNFLRNYSFISSRLAVLNKSYLFFSVLVSTIYRKSVCFRVIISSSTVRASSAFISSFIYESYSNLSSHPSHIFFHLSALFLFFLRWFKQVGILQKALLLNKFYHLLTFTGFNSILQIWQLSVSIITSSSIFRLFFTFLLIRVQLFIDSNRTICWGWFQKRHKSFPFGGFEVFFFFHHYCQLMDYKLCLILCLNRIMLTS